jgi:glycerate 2-kinase
MKGTLLDAARRMAAAAVEAVRPERLVQEALCLAGGRLEVQGREIEAAGPIDVLAAGKAAAGMAWGAAEVLEGRVRRGLIVAPPGSGPEPPGFTRLEAAHPHPDARSLVAGRAALDLAAGSEAEGLLLLLISGGGSSLLCAPRPGIDLRAKADTALALMSRGADIRELNTVRKHLSLIKGGGLARAAQGLVLNLLLSDVPGDDPEVIAAGPGHWDGTTFAETAEILRRRGLWDDAPPGVRQAVEAGLRGEAPETLKRSDPAARRISSYIIGRNATALAAARREAEGLGFKASILAAADTGEARDAAVRYIPSMLAALRGHRPGDPPVALIAGGEHSVTIRGRGLGGRNQEFVLAALVDLDRRARTGTTDRAVFADCARTGKLLGRDWLVMSFGTDGVDGPTDAAGAWGGPEVLVRAKALGMNMGARLDDNDSYRFFQKAGGLYKTGPTGTNVMDVRLLLIA